MAYQKLQVSTALEVIPSDYINIPNVSEKNATGTTDGATGLTDSTATFANGSIKVGDIVYDTTRIVVAKVTGIVSDTELSLDDGNGVAVNLTPASEYVIYKDTNKACVLYIGGTGDLVVEMANSGSAISFISAPAGYHPLQVNKVLSTGTTATNIVALW